MTVQVYNQSVWFVTLLQYIPVIFLLGIVLIQTGSVFTHSKDSSTRFFALEYCLGLACFILLSFLFSALPSFSANDGIFIGFIVCSLLATVMTFRFSRSLPSTVVNAIRTSWLLTLLVLCCCVLLAKLTFNNGLHDEYQHYAAIQLLSYSESLPGLHPYLPGESFSFLYHTGLYSVVWLLSSLSTLNIEEALDVAKISLFLPLPFLMAHFFQGRKPRTPLFQLAITIGILAGPSFFLFDNLSGNVLWGRNLPQLWMPVLYELAGLTWGAMSLFLAACIVLKRLARKSRWSLLMFFSLLLITVALALSNLGFFFAFTLCAPWIFFFAWKRVNITQAITLSLFSLGIILTLLTLLTPYIGVWRNIDTWGWAYVSGILPDGIQYEVKYVSLFSREFLFAFGVGWLWALLLFFLNLRNRPREMGIWAGFLFLLPFLSSIFRFFGDDLSLNKLWRPVFLLLPIFTLQSVLSLSPRLRKTALVITLIIWIFSLPAAGKYFLIPGVNGVQRFWSSPSSLQKVENALPHDQLPLQLVTTESELQFYLANSLPSQVSICQLQDEKCLQATPGIFYIVPKTQTATSSSFPSLFYQNEDFSVYSR